MRRVALFENKDQVTGSKLDWCLHTWSGRSPAKDTWVSVEASGVCVCVCMGGVA